MSNYRMGNSVKYVKCHQCGGVAREPCKECQFWYCLEHLHRHSDCSEGR